MAKRIKIKPNEKCPCFSGKKYKQCCQGKKEWEQIFESGEAWEHHLSVRGRNALFMQDVAEALQLDTEKQLPSMKDYKTAFTDQAVIKIHQAILRAWPPELDINRALSDRDQEISGLYVGDYHIDHLRQALVRHSTYSERLIVVDPFVYPTSVRDEFNPLLNPSQYRTRTLQNTNFWISLLPWITEGIVEVIRTPSDYDMRLNWDSMKRQRTKFENNEELNKAKEQTVKQLRERHQDGFMRRTAVLSMPDEALESFFDEHLAGTDGLSKESFIAHVQKLRDDDADFLQPVGPELPSQLMMISTGANYEIATITANLTNSYLVTDLYSKWREIELDRDNLSVQTSEWSPFAKAFHEVDLKFLDNLSLDQALVLRKEERLSDLRAFLRGVWKTASATDQFDEHNVILLADELKARVREAEDEWKAIDRDLLKWFGAEVGAGILAAPLVASGNGSFLAAGLAASGLFTLGATKLKRNSFLKRHPAAFFLDHK